MCSLRPTPPWEHGRESRLEGRFLSPLDNLLARWFACLSSPNRLRRSFSFDMSNLDSWYTASISRRCSRTVSSGYTNDASGTYPIAHAWCGEVRWTLSSTLPSVSVSCPMTT